MVVDGKRGTSVLSPNRVAIWATVSMPTSSHPSLMAIMLRDSRRPWRIVMRPLKVSSKFCGSHGSPLTCM